MLPGQLPASKASACMNFSSFYVANGVAGATGLPSVPGYHLRVSAVALKCAHTWGAHLLGGQLASQVAVPIIDIHLDLLTGSHNKVGLGNPNIETTVAYRTNSLLGWYGVEVYTPGPFYTKTDVVNLGQYNSAIAPAAALSKFQYIINYADNATPDSQPTVRSAQSSPTDHCLDRQRDAERSGQLPCCRHERLCAQTLRLRCWLLSTDG